MANGRCGVVRAMRWIVTGVLALGIGLMPMTGHAFQEEQLGSAQSAPAKKAPEAVAPYATLTDSDTSAAANSATKGGGTELSIPGLGTVGVIPKMDFGLELLYGSEGQRQREQEPLIDENEDLRIRGTIKHRF